ncbi:hypothetical protein CDES_01060 [Corynebacterium deserti GIMN1.010]|uniref:PAS/PAC domain-containing protein n=1 Tax=Corynebacterium deserti GIMN1.010 TaxID=931089 RepID=A0A0M4CMQ4_9CORY|nr:PAS domain S-box protein [Corynebacterium deserti]ALC04692.1 hypothetical protein CDES_01060 [Corynebacterium deserti GIMN1.010]
MVDFDEISARLLAETQEAIIYATRDGVIRFWNGGAEELFGFSAGEALGKSLDIIIPEKHRNAHWDGWDRVMDSGNTRYGSEPLNVPGIKADGSTMSLEFSITILKDDDGTIEGIAAFLRDVTTKWNEKKALRVQIKELERQIEDASG